MKRLLLVLVLAAQLGGCAHGGQIAHSAKQTGIYVAAVAALIAVVALSDCETCEFQSAPDIGARR